MLVLVEARNLHAKLLCDIICPCMTCRSLSIRQHHCRCQRTRLGVQVVILDRHAPGHKRKVGVQVMILLSFILDRQAPGQKRHMACRLNLNWFIIWLGFTLLLF